MSSEQSGGEGQQSTEDDEEEGTSGGISLYKEAQSYRGVNAEDYL